MDPDLDRFQRNTAFAALMLICAACSVYLTGQVQDTLIPLLWAAFFAPPITMLVAYLDKFIARDTVGGALAPDRVEFRANETLGINNILLTGTGDHPQDFLNKVNNPCPCPFSSYLNKCCKRRVKIDTDFPLGRGVNRFAKDWAYYAGSNQRIVSPEGSEVTEIEVGLFLDKAERYPAVIDAEDVERVDFTGTLNIDKKSSLSWVCALMLTFIIVVGAIWLFVWLVETGVKSFTDDLTTYSDGARSLVAWLKPHVPPSVWTKLEKGAKNLADGALPQLASGLAESIAKLGYQCVFLTIYLLFWICEPLPIKSELLQLIKTYLFIKTGVCILFASLMSLLLFQVGCKLWKLFFVLNFVLNYIPEIGAILCFILPIPAILLNGGAAVESRLWQFVWFLLGGITIKLITGNIIEVRCYTTKGGQFMRMHPVVLMALMMACTAVFGVTGAFVAVPVLAGVKYWILSANMPDAYLHPLLVFIEGDEMAPHRNFVDRHPEEAECVRQPRAAEAGAGTELLAREAAYVSFD